VKALPTRPLTADAFAPYGWVAEAGARAGRFINDGSSLRVDGDGELDLQAAGGRPCLAVFRAQARDPRGPWQTLERHALGTQTFVPMGHARCVVLVALGETAPDPTTLAAFVASGTQAVTLRAGTWHHGLIALDAGDFVVIERAADAVDCDLATLPEPVALLIDTPR
jgi:ureidoglycolate lyase